VSLTLEATADDGTPAAPFPSSEENEIMRADNVNTGILVPTGADFRPIARQLRTTENSTIL
jgi:hypothetical protein